MFSIIEKWDDEKITYKVVELSYVLLPNEYFIQSDGKNPNEEFLFKLESDAEYFKEELEGTYVQ